MIRALFCPHPTHKMTRTCDDPTFWRTVEGGGITCDCKEAKK